MFINQKDRTTLIQVLTLYLVSDSGDNLIEDDIRTDAEEFLTKLKDCEELLGHSDPRKVERDFDEDEEDFQDELDNEEDDLIQVEGKQYCRCQTCSCGKEKEVLEEGDWTSLFVDLIKLPTALVECLDSTLPLAGGGSMLKPGNRYNISFVGMDGTGRLGINLKYQRAGEKKNGKKYLVRSVENIQSITFHENNAFTIFTESGDEVDFSFVLDNHEDVDVVEKWDDEFGEVPLNNNITFSLL